MPQEESLIKKLLKGRDDRVISYCLGIGSYAGREANLRNFGPKSEN